MNNEIEVGDFVRLKQGYIGTVENINDFRETIMKYAVDIQKRDLVFVGDDDIVKHSKNLIDLIEVGDYVNGWKVLAKTKIKNNEMQVCILTCFEDEHWITINNETLKTIVTKEQFRSLEYII